MDEKTKPRHAGYKPGALVEPKLPNPEKIIPVEEGAGILPRQTANVMWSEGTF